MNPAEGVREEGMNPEEGIGEEGVNLAESSDLVCGRIKLTLSV